MAPQIGFYHLTTTSLDQALPRLLDKASKSGHRVLVMAGSEERVAALDSLLWTYEADSWLPHGSDRSGDAALQPIYLTARDENPNHAGLLLLVDGVTSAHLDGFARCLNLFDGHDDLAVQVARQQWKSWSAAGYPLVYYQQSDRGQWQEKARANADTVTNGDDAGNGTP